MPQGHALSLEGAGVGVAADRGSPLSKPPQEQIVLVEGHGPRSDFASFRGLQTSFQA